MTKDIFLGVYQILYIIKKIHFLIISETPASCNIVLELFNALLVFLDLSNLLLYFGL